MKNILSALIFSLVATGVSPAYAATVSRLESAPGQSQSDWEATDAYKAFVCPEGTLRGGGVDMNFTTDRGDDKYFVTCDEPSPTAADDADFNQRSRDAAAAAEVESQAYSAANPGKQKCIQWGPIVHRNGVSTSSGGVCANIVPVSSTSESSTASSSPAPESSTAPSPAPSATPSATPTPTNSNASANSQINVGIWLISGRTSEIYGRGDGIADSANQIQWVTCLESLSGSMLYPNRDNLNYTYTVTGPTGVVDSGAYRPTWIDSMSSCTGNGGGNQYTAAYNLTGLISGTSYQFTVSGSNANVNFTSTKSFTTLSAPSAPVTTTPIISDTRTATTAPVSNPSSESTTSTSTPIQAPVSSGTAAPISTPTPVTAPPSASAPISTPAPSTPAPTSTPAPAPTSSSNDDETLDEVAAEEEIIDSIEAIVQSNGTTRIQVSTGYLSTALTVVATRKGSKKKYTYKITTNAEGDRKFKSGLNLRGYTVILYKGSTELDRMYIS
jgi:hypothetical protein